MGSIRDENVKVFQDTERLIEGDETLQNAMR